MEHTPHKHKSSTFAAWIKILNQIVARADMFMPYMYCLTVINVTPMYCSLWGRAVCVTTMMWSLVAPCRCDNNLWCRGVVIVTAPPPPPPPCLMYTLKRIYIYIYAEFLTIIHLLISYLIGSEAKWQAFRSRRHFRMYIAKWKLNVLKSDRSFSTGLETGLARCRRIAIV